MLIKTTPKMRPLMTKRRELLKVLSVAGAAGAVWKKPVVDSVALPAHADTTATPSPTPTPSCGGCYNLLSGQSMLFPEGVSPGIHSNVIIYDSPDCSGNIELTTAGAVLATDITEAQAIMDVPGSVWTGCTAVELSTNDSMCNLYGCPAGPA
jgi:hypothetical protein